MLLLLTMMMTTTMMLPLLPLQLMMQILFTDSKLQNALRDSSVPQHLQQLFARILIHPNVLG